VAWRVEQSSVVEGGAGLSGTVVSVWQVGGYQTRRYMCAFRFKVAKCSQIKPL
jgi:hypothetical protein